MPATLIRSILLVIFVMTIAPCIASAGPYKVLVVMSYEEHFIYVKEIKQGIEAALPDDWRIKYAYLNTRDDFAGGKTRAKEAYELYQAFEPDGVIAADDNAQSMFVVPYLKGKVKTPVLFCGVDAKPEKYGYPAANVTGILQRIHSLETLIFLKQLLPHVEKVGFIVKKGPTGAAWIEQMKQDTVNSPVEIVDYRTPVNMPQALEMAREMRDTCDALFIGAMQRIRDENDMPLEDEIALPMLAQAFGKPVFTNTRFRVQFGALCAVVDLAYEQGKTAAEMLLKVKSGTPVADIPIVRTQYGRRVINIKAMKALGIKPSRTILVGAELVE